MKIQTIQISNYNSIKDVKINVEDMLNLVGQNNAGKSNILKAVDLFFNPTLHKITEETYHNRDTSVPIEITIDFCKLTDSEKAYFSSYVIEGILRVKRRFSWSASESKPTTSHIGYGKVPKLEWLREDEVSGDNITTWWSDKDNLVVNGNKFTKYCGTAKPNVGQWKESITKCIEENKTNVEYETMERDNIKGYDSYLKIGLPKCIFIPAVRDINDETKILKTNPFGVLMNQILLKISDTDKKNLSDKLSVISKLLNYEGGTERIQSIPEIEKSLNTHLSDLIKDCTLELHIPVPTFDDIFKNANIIADDGFKGSILNKGHGLQRYVIFTILRIYSKIIEDATKPEPTVIFLIEEPEIYLHPQAQRTMYEVLKKISKGNDQIIYATHSSLFVDITYFDHVAVVSKTSNGDDKCTNVMQLPMQKLLEDLKARHPSTTPTDSSIRERSSHAYNPLRNEGFFAKKIILVEGQSEEYALPIYCDVLKFNLDINGVSIINAGGKGTIDRYLRVFNEFGIPCYVIFDGDKDYAAVGEAISVLGIDLPQTEGYAVAQLVDDSASSYNASLTEQKILASHETGHVMGANHNNSQISGKYTIMAGGPGGPAINESTFTFAYYSTSKTEINTAAHSYL
ncbi:MAG: ATP-dependent endonuclease [Nitrosarchaeum sp.]|nr:ATP-dependent endonuclease [Nitrosarchaeum sp.]